VTDERVYATTEDPDSMKTPKIKPPDMFDLPKLYKHF